MFELGDQLKNNDLYHSDIKPQNIMVDKDYNIYLIDVDSFHKKTEKLQAHSL